ncbi:uncharacterized protein [Blastocystis hominis]|uniref:UDP-N-acetylglucosamine transferase subunit ALG14 n=1 Tax=Blastocystis hominis TaxID=12968 RepID=D8M0T7_BLAHO|nr:uncharacterized protein [Blastocystis hominis]CBK21676.2 unnamed protein product [Blastocystis hominis]|eukprot:XP_012895724.1 uncharacterized protein [Blastocystis hominis]
MVVLGSGTACFLNLFAGGHTSEMLALLHSLDPSLYTPMVIVSADTDKKSISRYMNENFAFDSTIKTIPRSREVGQSYFSSIRSTFRAFLRCLVLILFEQPNLLLINGPGTCIPVALVVVLYRILDIIHCRIVFVESFCRVERLSVSGYLLYYVADSFVVQWPQLQKKYPRSVYLGVLMYIV